MEIATPRQLPVVAYEGKQWFFDRRLRQIRSIENPYDYQNLDELELGYFDRIASGDELPEPLRIVWKDEGRDAEGRSVGPAYTEDVAGRIVHNYGWITWKRAEEIAKSLGIDLNEV